MMLPGNGVLVPGSSMVLPLPTKLPCNSAVVGSVVADRRRLLAQPLPLLAHEEEQLVLLDGAAEVVAEIVVAQLGEIGREEIARVQSVVAEVFEGPAVKLVGAVLGHEVESHARGAAVLGGEVGGLNLDLLQ